MRRPWRDTWNSAEPADDRDLDRLRAKAEDRRPAVALRAVQALARAHVASEDTKQADAIWGDAPLFVKFATRTDVPAKARAVVVADIAYTLAVLYLVALGMSAIFPATIVSVLTRDHALALAVRGFAEIALGDIQQARRLANAADRVAPDHFLTRALLQRIRMIPQNSLASSRPAS